MLDDVIRMRERGWQAIFTICFSGELRRDRIPALRMGIAPGVDVGLLRLEIGLLILRFGLLFPGIGPSHPLLGPLRLGLGPLHPGVGLLTPLLGPLCPAVGPLQPRLGSLALLIGPCFPVICHRFYWRDEMYLVRAQVFSHALQKLNERRVNHAPSFFMQFLRNNIFCFAFYTYLSES